MNTHVVRVKLKFDSTPVSYAKKCWFTFDTEKCKLVKDVAHLVASHFGLHSALGIQVKDQWAISIILVCLWFFSCLWKTT